MAIKMSVNTIPTPKVILRIGFSAAIKQTTGDKINNLILSIVRHL